MRTPAAESRCTPKNLRLRKPICLRGASPDSPLPAETIRGTRAIEKMREEVMFALSPVGTMTHGPLRGQPHAGLVHHPTVAFEFVEVHFHATHRSIPRISRRVWFRCECAAQRLAGDRAEPRVEMPAILLPAKFVAELPEVSRRAIDRTMHARQREQTVTNPR